MENDLFDDDHLYVKSESDREGMRNHAKKRKVRHRARSARASIPECDLRCGTNEDIHCGLSQVKVSSAVPCCITSLRALARDVANINAISPKEDATLYEKLRAVFTKNDRIFYLMSVVAAIAVVIAVVKLLSKNKK